MVKHIKLNICFNQHKLLPFDLVVVVAVVAVVGGGGVVCCCFLKSDAEWV